MALHFRIKPGEKLTLLSGEVIENMSSVAVKLKITKPNELPTPKQPPKKEG